MNEYEIRKTSDGQLIVGLSDRVMLEGDHMGFEWADSEADAWKIAVILHGKAGPNNERVQASALQERFDYIHHSIGYRKAEGSIPLNAANWKGLRLEIDNGMYLIDNSNSDETPDTESFDIAYDRADRMMNALLEDIIARAMENDRNQ